jgi:hypothetical protein
MVVGGRRTFIISGCVLMMQLPVATPVISQDF